MKKNRLFHVLVCLLVFVVGSVQADEEQDLITILQSDAGVPQKWDACFKLRRIGTARSTPALAALLNEERLSHAARNTLAGMPCPEAGEALRQALGRSSDLIKAGLIDSLGWRRERQALPLLTPLLSDTDAVIASASASALGRIGGKEAVTALSAAAGRVSPEVRPAVLEGLLKCAAHLRAAGDQSDAAAVYRDLFNKRSPTRIHVAAWRGLVLSDSGQREALMTEALRGRDHPTRQAALKLIRELDDEQVIQACVQHWDSLPADSQLAVLDAHIKRGKKAMPLVRTAVQSRHPAVQVAAIEAAGSVGDSSLVRILAEWAAHGTQAQQAASRQSLSRLAGDDVDPAILSLLDSSDPALGVESIGAMRRRGMTTVVAGRLLLDQAQSGVPQVRQAALDALGDLAGTEQIGELVALLAGQQGSGRADEVARTVIAAARRLSAEDRAARLVLQRLPEAEGPNRAVLLGTLGQLGSRAGRRTLKQALEQEADPELREAALRALAPWPDASFVPDLLQVARTSDKIVHRVLAVRTAIKLVDRSKTSSDVKIQSLRKVMQVAERADEKRAALAALARIQTAVALQLACDNVSDASLRAEAVQAVMEIGQAISGAEPKAVAQAMKVVAAAPVALERKQQAQALLLEVESVQSYLRHWQVAGPYLQEGRNHAQLFDIPFGPEKPGGDVEWKAIGVKAEYGHPAYVDLLETFGGEQRVAYLRTRIEADAEHPARLELYTDDGVKAWLNGKLVHANNVARPIMAEPDRVNVTLRSGINTLMLKITQNSMPWGAIVRVRQARSAPKAALGEGFRLHVINAESRFEAAGILDVNRDGKLDILCGGFWYEAPDWKQRFVREIREQGGYYYDFANLPMDVDGDGWIDTVGAAWHNKMVYWVRNPGKGGGAWEIFEIDTPGNMETAMAYDINGDGQMDLLPNIMKAAAWYEYHRDASAPQGVRWEKHVLPQEAAGHGLGAGDVNGDGRRDIVTPRGWLEQTADGWQWRAEFELGHASIPILVHDVDRDGDSDIIWGLGHNYGLFWLEQTDDGGRRAWERHAMDDSWSQPHYMLMADLDNDEQDELVTGKRFHAHNGKDPGGNEPPCVYYYDFDCAAKTWTRHVMHEGGRVGLGINTGAADMDGDGDIDVVAPGKTGLYLFENLTK